MRPPILPRESPQRTADAAYDTAPSRSIPSVRFRLWEYETLYSFFDKLSHVLAFLKIYFFSTQNFFFHFCY